MYEYTLIQSLTYPKINFKFNGKSLNYTPKKFLGLFDKDYVLHEHDDYFVAFLPNEYDDFKQISYVNGLETSRGGSHVDYVIDSISNALKDKLIKKYKTIKPSDIKHKLVLVLIAKNFKNLNWDGQTKESITNPKKDMSSYFADMDFEKLADRLYKTQSIIDPITEVYKIKEELKKRQEMKGLEKTKKKIKSDKYLPSIGVKKYLIVTEGFSASGGLIPVLGRKEAGYYSLRGKPLNVINSSFDKFKSNQELTELYQIIKNEGYEKIIVASDADLDGLHIRGLMLGFINKMLPEFKSSFGLLNTPVLISKKNNKVVNWSYNLHDSFDKKGGEVHYIKGLGSHIESDLKEIVKTDGLHNMIQMVDFDSEQIIQDWLATENSDVRKDYIANNSFDIASL
jgi:DNA topoisomerase-2